MIRNHGPLGALYPKLAYIMEGDTPSFLGLIDKGLGWAVSPAYGGWGGRYQLYQPWGETRPIWTNNQDSRDTVTADNGQTECTDAATVWRWREHFQHDFAARMDWCVAAEYGQANHAPRTVLNGDRTTRIVELSAEPGETVTLSSSGSEDPDGQAVTSAWFIYVEAGTLLSEARLSEACGETTQLVLPALAAQDPNPATVHAILIVRDDGTPSLVSYRRAIVTVSQPAR